MHSASFHAVGPGSTTSRSMWRFPVTGSIPAYPAYPGTRVPAYALGNTSMSFAAGIADRLNRSHQGKRAHYVPRGQRGRSCERRFRRSDVEPEVGIEPTTYRLQGGCSTS